MTSCAPPHETQDRVCLTCSKSQSWPMFSLMHTVPQLHCSRTLALTVASRLGPMHRVILPHVLPHQHVCWALRASCSHFWCLSRLGLCLVLCQPLPQVQCYHHPTAPDYIYATYITHVVCQSLCHVLTPNSLPWGQGSQESSQR